MLTVTGKYGTATVFVDKIESSARQQIQQMMDHIAFADLPIVIMPDVHAGAGSVIGFTSPIGPKVIPSLVGVDIGCGVIGWNLGKCDIDFRAFDHIVRRLVPSGFALHNEMTTVRIQHDSNSLLFPSNSLREAILEAIMRMWPEDSVVGASDRTYKVLRSVGTLGGGNHFIELDKDEDKNIWLVIHSGSRNFGLQVATHHQKIAVSKVGKMGGLEYLEGDDLCRYLSDMGLAQSFARLNRWVMGTSLCQEMGLNIYELPVVESVHNYINPVDRIVRKGAISAHKGEQVIIPLTMADGIVLGVGKGVESWNCSAPHGAGRTMGRGEAKRNLSVEEFEYRMKKAGVWSSCVGRSTLDEAPMAYKDPGMILDILPQTVEITNRLKPIYSFKSADEKKRKE